MRTLILIAIAMISACTTREPPGETTGDSPPAAAHAPFVDRVWIVAESAQVSQGDLRVFLPDGTLVMSSPHATTAFGTWTYADDRLRITEEGLEYQVDILELTADTFRIRVHNPDEPVEIGFASAGDVLHLAGTVRHLDLEGGPCHDSMSGKPFEATVTPVFDGRHLDGCGSAVT